MHKLDILLILNAQPKIIQTILNIYADATLFHTHTHAKNKYKTQKTKHTKKISKITSKIGYCRVLFFSIVFYLKYHFCLCGHCGVIKQQPKQANNKHTHTHIQTHRKHTNKINKTNKKSNKPKK